MNPQHPPRPTLAVEPGFFAGRTLADLQDAMRQGALSAEALVRHAGAAIERLNPQLNAFVHVDIDAALATARALDDERAQGRVRGPLHGIPVAIKDNVDTADMPTTMGAAHFLGHRPAADADCVALLRAAGAIVVGKTLTHEFAYGPTGDRSVQGASRNPWRTTQITGGSSAGSAAAVASGMVPVALGTDTGGSVRVPSALCGLVGFKPTHGRVSAQGLFPLSPSIEDAGVLANTVQDAQAFMQALSGGAIGAFADAADPGLAAPRMMWVPNAPFAIDEAAVTACVRAAALRFLGASDDAGLQDGAEVTRHARALQGALGAIQRSEAYAVHAERVEDEPEKFDPEVLERLRASRPVQGWEYVRAINTRTRLRAVFAEIFERVDVLALPTVAITAPALQQRSVAGPGSAGVRETLLGLTNPWNLLGLPAIALPAGFVDGMPVSLQLVAAEGSDARLLALAAQRWQPPV
ncbi:amidase [Achromobacter deleyi]|uniref:amidase n=1 Tax=Achromobacter deleyi TaxID=1353891 RepID=UPI00146810E2|nr:amidase [Achromobacter deleyi]CAB3915334.1 2-amino-5-chloromuconic acid deaminase [Achromobacter deleyi]